MTALKKGFTLIELLIVMAILGVLAVVVLVAINPAEQLRRARDAGRMSGVQQIGRAIAAYYTANGCLPGAGVVANCPATASVGDDLTASQELTAIPAEITQDPLTCTNVQVGSGDTWCYAFSGAMDGVYVVYSQLASQQRVQQCVGMGSSAPVFAIFSSSAARGGVFCGGEPGANSVPTI